MLSKIKPRLIRSTTLKFILLITASLATITTAEAYPDNPIWKPAPPSYHRSPIRVDIINDRGRAFRHIPTSSKAYNVKRGYIQAKKGKRYSLRLRNTSNKRVGLVVTVDGRNILSGKKSWLRSNEKMYILDPYETAIYDGWRTGKNRVNRFFFTNAGNSYANAWGDRTAMGVIAIAVFNERPRPVYRYNNKSVPSSSNRLRRSAPANDAGTGFGREEYSPTIKVSFRPQGNPVSKHFYKYEWRSSLCKRGVIVCQDRPKKKPHNRFWSEDSYAPYPPGWQRNNYRPNNNRRNNDPFSSWDW